MIGGRGGTSARTMAGVHTAVGVSRSRTGLYAEAGMQTCYYASRLLLLSAIRRVKITVYSTPPSMVNSTVSRPSPKADRAGSTGVATCHAA